MVRARNVVVVGLFLLLVTAGTASAAVNWQSVEALDLVRGVPRPDVGINAAGNSIVVYTHADTTFDEPRPWFAVRPPGGDFTVKMVKPGGREDAQVAVAPNGATAIAAVDRGRLYVTLYPAPGPAGAAGKGPTDGTPTQIDVGGVAIDGLKLAIDGAGRATVVWASPRVGGFDDPPTQIYTATVPTPSWGMAPAQPLGEPGRCRPGIDVNLRGDTVVSRECVRQPDDFFYRPAGGEFGAAEAPFGGGEPGPGDGRIGMALDGAGSVHAYQGLSASDPRGTYHLERASYAVRPAAGPFGPAQRLDFASSGLELEAQEDGDVIVSWGRSYAFRPPGGPFGPVRTVPGTTRATGFDLVTSPHGPALLSWREQFGLGYAQTEQVTAAVITAAGASEPASLGTPGILGGSLGSPVRFAINDAGHAVGAWEQRCSSEGASAVMAVALDSASNPEQPLCKGPQGPAVTVLGKRARLSGRLIRVRLACDEACWLMASGHVARRRSHRRLTRTKKARVHPVAAHSGAWLRFTLSRSEARRIRLALAARRPLTMRLAVRASDAHPHHAVRQLAVPLRR